MTEMIDREIERIGKYMHTYIYRMDGGLVRWLNGQNGWIDIDYRQILKMLGRVREI